ncbi:MAG: hypothetical protein OXH52_18035 [Gammaproteobacteria bacterium]|nr:hypothetical protein [Gammaproteobacteria bacterium]
MAPIDSATIDRRSSPDRKIALFRSLFRGREDVYPRRFESRTSGRSGYAPACRNEWVPGVCDKPRIKCAECPNRRFLAITDNAIRQHLLGADEHGKPFANRESSTASTAGRNTWACRAAALRKRQRCFGRLESGFR